MENSGSIHLWAMPPQAILGRGGNYAKEVGGSFDGKASMSNAYAKKRHIDLLREKAVCVLAKQPAKQQSRTPLSSGALKDLAYVSLCYGILKTALEIDDGTCSEDGAIKRNHYKTSKRLNRRIEKIRDRLHKVMEKYAYEAQRMHKMN